MESTELRYRCNDKKQLISKNPDVSKNLEVTYQSKFLDIKDLKDFGTYSRGIKVKPYDLINKIYITITNGFLIKEMKDYSFCVIGRLVNGEVMSITDEEQKICESEGLKVGDVPKSSGFLGFW